MADSAAGQTDVLVVGAGPVGLTLAVDLGRRGVRCTLIEQKAAPEFLPKMERCNARTMEIFRRMGLADEDPRRGAAGGRPDGRLRHPRDERAAAAAAAVSVGRRGARADRRVQRRLDAARALSAHLAVHARAAAEGGGRSAAERDRPLRLRIRLAVAGRGRRRRNGPRCRRRGSRRDPRALHRRLRRRRAARSAGSSASSCAARGTCCACTRRSTTAPTLYDRIPIGDGPGRGRHYHVADGQADVPDHAGLDAALDAARDGRTAGGHGRAVRADDRRPGAVRDALRRRSGSRTCCWPTATAPAACFSPATRRTW